MPFITFSATVISAASECLLAFYSESRKRDSLLARANYFCQKSIVPSKLVPEMWERTGKGMKGGVDSKYKMVKVIKKISLKKRVS